MPLLQTVPPASEPITLTEAKAHLRVDVTDDDAYITALITAAREYAEGLTDRQFITATWSLVLDAFPGPSLMGVPAGVPFSMPGHAVQLEKSPIQTVSSIQYLDMAGTLQTMPSSDYATELVSAPGRITPAFGKIWPVTLPQIGAVKITFVAGYGNAAAVPQGIKNWMLIRLATLYENREEVALMNRGKIEPLPYVDRLLDSYCVVTF
jgi:uncharacterized phiE125 gp8 family phage protein